MSETAPDAAGEPSLWTPCSDSARARPDPLWATAGHGSRWFLVEVALGWGPRALLDPPFDAELGRRIVRRTEGAGMRPLAIRRPGRRLAPPRWRWAVVDSRPGFESVIWGEVDDPRALAEVPLDGSAGVPTDRPLFAVCAHGRHDRCCAVRGRGAAQRLAAVHPEETWECSHLGGDRFAATMVMFPHGVAYGRVDDANVADLATAYLHGRVDERFYRGRTSLPQPVQAAQHLARLQYGDDRLGAYAPLEPGMSPQPDGRYVIDLADGDAVVRVELAQTLSPPVASSCAAGQRVRVYEWELRDIRRVSDNVAP